MKNISTALCCGVASLAVVMATTGCDQASTEESSANPSAVAQPSNVQRAHKLAQVAQLDPPGDFGHVTILESPTFGPDGQLYFVSLSAPAGSPKVLKFDTDTHEVTTVYADADSGFSSVQFSPVDGRMYLTDYNKGAIASMMPDGSDFRIDWHEQVDGRHLTLDDIAFDRDGNMYVTDEGGRPWDPTGVILRFDPTGKNPRVLLRGMAGANGISFSPDYSMLWVSQYRRDEVDKLVLSPDGLSVADGLIGMRANTGVGGFDSNAVDSAGNVYQCIWDGGRILVWDSAGNDLGTITIPQDLPKSQLLGANMAIRPGTKEGFIVVGGENGGFIYAFDAYADGGRQSNGG
jgi:lactonase